MRMTSRGYFAATTMAGKAKLLLPLLQHQPLLPLLRHHHLLLFLGHQHQRRPQLRMRFSIVQVSNCIMFQSWLVWHGL